MRIAFDEHIPPKVAEAIKALSGEEGMLRAEIVLAKQYVAQPLRKQESDVPWIEEFATSGGKVIVSGDARMRAKPHELRALVENNLIVIFFARQWNQLDGYGKTAMLVRWWPYVLKVLESAAPRQMFEIPCSYHGIELKEVTPKRRHKPGAKPKAKSDEAHAAHEPSES